MRKLLLTLSAIFLLLISGYAQKRTITGTVTDEKGNPIANASVQIKGTVIGTTTNADGTYSISVPPNGKTLVFSSVNAEAQQIPIGSDDVVNLIRFLLKLLLPPMGLPRKKHLPELHLL